MLKSFFEIGCGGKLFDGLAISEENDICSNHMGKYPVISISLKGVNGADYSTARALMCSEIGNEAMRFQFILDDQSLTVREKAQYEQLIRVGNAGEESFIMSDAVLTGCLLLVAPSPLGSKTPRQVDEVGFPAKPEKTTLSSQCHSIFTGLNNLIVFSITDEDCDSYFGFTDEEVRKMLKYYDLDDKYDLIKEWYDGYCFGNTDVYCPWDVINYVNRLLVRRTLPPQDYWSNTSSNDVVRHYHRGQIRGKCRL